MEARRLATRSAIGISILALTACGGGEQRAAAPPPESDSSNFRVLTKSKSSALVAYANAAYDCARRTIDVSKPVAEGVRIVMSTSASVKSSVRAIARCGDDLGPPPPRASVQARKGEIVVYVPKRCLLDPRVGAEAM